MLWELPQEEVIQVQRHDHLTLKQAVFLYTPVGKYRAEVNVKFY